MSLIKQCDQSTLLRYFRKLGTHGQEAELKRIQRILPSSDLQLLESMELEYVYNVEIGGNELNQHDREVLLWLITETFEPELVGERSLHSPIRTSSEYIVEVGPRLAFSTAWCSNCLSMLRSCGVECITRIERNRRYKLHFRAEYTQPQLDSVVSALYDRMTECVYAAPLESFHSGEMPAAVVTVPVLTEGRAAVKRINAQLGLGLDDRDLDYYTHVFAEVLRRDPTDVELFDIGQSNSEHSRHWFFGGKITIDGAPQEETLFSMVKSTLLRDAPSNSVIAFHDNSSALRGCEGEVLLPVEVGTASPMHSARRLMHPILTAETHNFPSGIAPFAGAETGTGGRLRDVQATGRGAHTLAGVCGYCVGNLHIPQHSLPWEQPLRAGTSADSTSPVAVIPQLPVDYPANLASPLSILVKASNGASDYGNKFGEPVVTGFARSFGLQLPAYTPQTGPPLESKHDDAQRMRVEWLKPIMFTAGVGWLEDQQVHKLPPAEGMLVCKMGGPAYRIGMGGGAASSRVQTSGFTTAATQSVPSEPPQEQQQVAADTEEELDFNAVQRGDAEMENRMNRLVRACAEPGDRNPILSIHDQGAGGNGNVLKELVDPLGARIQLRSIPVGDPTLSVLEMWGAEYQENNAFLTWPGDAGWDLVRRIAERENCPVAAVGVVTGDGRVTVEAPDGSTPFDLPLSLVLGKMPQKEFQFTSSHSSIHSLRLPADTTFASALDRVLRLVDVGSKRFLTNKVDRSVTGLVAQQQCVGPLHTPLADVAALAQSHFATTGLAVAVGEQPIKGLLSPSAQARMTVCEALSNLAFARVTSLGDVKASCNWMWPAKITEPHQDGVNVEGARMWEACGALRDCLLQLGVGIDGGKDSLTMAAKVGEELVRSPGQVTLTCYAACPDITRTVTPDLKHPGEGLLLYIDLGEGNYRLGGTALSTVYQQLGDACADMSPSALDTFRRCFHCIQQCLSQGLIQTGHDRSDGGLVTTLLEMAFAGNVGIEVTLREEWLRTAQESFPSTTETKLSGAEAEGIPPPAFMALGFGEEAGFVLEVLPENLEQVLSAFEEAQVEALLIGRVVAEPVLYIEYERLSKECVVLLNGPMQHWRDVWEATSFALELRQCDADCVRQEAEALRSRTAPPSHLSFTPVPSPLQLARTPATHQPRVAVLRQEGTNGDREMLSAFHTTGFEAWDVNMHDLLAEKVDLAMFRGVVFCGGFSYADVNDSAKGWAAGICFNPRLLQQFTTFRERVDTFSLGVCNGCQLMALLGWVPFEGGVLPSGSDAGGCDQEGGGEVVKVKAEEQARFVHNASGRFESRWSAVQVLPSPAVLLQGMEGSTLGIWVAHGEGRAHFPNPAHLQTALERNLAPLRYVDDQDQCTERYPFNPNGSPHGIAALCSENGRHLAIMPHPERSFLKWQIPYMTVEDRANWQAAPWLKLFQNALQFCEQA